MGKLVQVTVTDWAGETAVSLAPAPNAAPPPSPSMMLELEHFVQDAEPPPLAAASRAPVEASPKGAPSSTDAVPRSALRSPPSSTAQAIPISPDRPIDRLFHRLVAEGASDLHLSANEAPMIRKDGDMARVSLKFGGSSHAGIEDLHRTSAGVVTFDPTLSRALLLAEDDETLWQHLQRGGIWVIPIVLFALFASIAAAAKGVWLYRLPPLAPALGERVQAAQSSEDALRALTKQVQGPQGELLGVALKSATREERDDRLYAALLAQRNRLERGLGAIAMTASIAPLLGLLGTVSGMITTFKAMTLFGSGDPNVVSGGIAEALITTELGLVVAIPALLAHALMSRRVKSYFAQLENDAVQLSQLPLRTGEA